MAAKVGLFQRWQEYRPSKTLFFWSCVASAVATIVIGFNWGGWVLGGTAAHMAAQAADDARAQLAAAVCVSRFEHAPDAAAKLATLKDTKIWDQNDFIRQGGWDTLPGTRTPVKGAADICAQRLRSAKLPAANATSKSG